ncbi:MAG: glucosamine inositolphosphorylceramide transferase family protein [Gemmatimonadaceae bacterium]
MIQKLRELHERGWEYLEQRRVPSAPYEGRRRIYRRPTNWEVIRWAGPRVAAKAARRAARMLTARHEVEHWRIAIRVGHPPLGNGTPDMSGFRSIESPRGHYYADPFLVERDGRIWIFFEDFLYGAKRGVISVAELGADGSMGPPQVALDTGGHLSYPYVFFDGDVAYMIPESAGQSAVRLYRATAFPFGWELHAELYSGTAVDTSVYRQSNVWWFFTTLREPRGQGTMLALFHADSLTGRWIPHPMSPVSVDIRTARCAGAIGRRGDVLIRPSQDGSRTYGFSFTLNEIVTLSPSEYEERALVTVGPGWDPELLGTHTYNRVGAIEVTDGKVRRRRADVI